MKVGLVSTESGVAGALEWRGRWLNLSKAYQVYQLVTQDVEGELLRRIETMLAQGLLSVEALAKIAAFVERHNLIPTLQFSEEPRFLLPLRPKQIIALGRNYTAHAAETGHDAPKEPIIFSKSPRACIGPGEPIVLRPSYGRVDHEAELAVIIGRTAKNIAPEEARECIAAYTLLNDVTARDMQKADIDQGHPWFRSKSIDTFCPLGPVLALPDELPWPVAVDIECRVNGELRQRSNTSKFIFSLPEVLAFISRFITLEPGDVVTTGTPEGISPIVPGDVVEVTVPQIGTLRNPVQAG